MDVVWYWDRIVLKGHPKKGRNISNIINGPLDMSPPLVSLSVSGTQIKKEKELFLLFTVTHQRGTIFTFSVLSLWVGTVLCGQSSWLPVVSRKPSYLRIGD